MSICRACLKRDKALDIGLPEENWHVLDRLVLAIRTTDINYSMANGNDEENLTVAPYMDYTRLFQRLLFNSPLTGLRQSSSHWRSVIYTGRSAKISSKCFHLPFTVSRPSSTATPGLRGLCQFSVLHNIYGLLL